MSIILNPAKSLSANSTEEFLSESEPSIMRPKNLTGLECIEGMKDEDSGWSVAFETEKGAEFMDLPLIMTIEQDCTVRLHLPTIKTSFI